MWQQGPVGVWAGLGVRRRQGLGVCWAGLGVRWQGLLGVSQGPVGVWTGRGVGQDLLGVLGGATRVRGDHHH